MEINQTQSGNQFQGFGLPYQQIIEQMSKDMNFLGIMAIIYGILTCLPIITAVIGVPIIFAGIRMRETSEYFLGFAHTNDQNILWQAIERQGRFLRIFRILTIVYLSLLVLYIIGIIIFFGIVGTSFFENMDFVQVF